MSDDGLEELLVFWTPLALGKARSGWEREFLGDMARRANWRNWRPSKKQRATLERLVRELFQPDPEVIDRTG